MGILILKYLKMLCLSYSLFLRIFQDIPYKQTIMLSDWAEWSIKLREPFLYSSLKANGVEMYEGQAKK